MKPLIKHKTFKYTKHKTVLVRYANGIKETKYVITKKQSSKKVLKNI